MLEVRELWVTPPGARDPVVRGVTFTVPPGGWVALTGPNGSGKSTLLLAAAGLLPPGRGTVTWRGRPPREAPRAAPVLAVLQDPSSQILEDTVGGELRMTAANLGRPPDWIEARVREVRDELGLDDDEGADPRTLSAGGRQRVVLAAALVAEPALLVADEPCAHLDPGSRSRVLAALAARARRGLAVLAAAQDPAEVAAATAVVALGAAAATVPVERRSAPGPPFAQVLIQPPAPGGRGARIRVAEPLRFALPSRGIVAVEGPNGAGKTVLLEAVTGARSLEQVVVTGVSGPLLPLMTGQFPELLVVHDRVEDELTDTAVLRGIPRAQALAEGGRVLARLGLDLASLARRATWDLSAGEKRMLAIAAALIAPCPLLALDEPTAGLDPQRRAKLADVLIARSRDTPVLVAGQDRVWNRAIASAQLFLGDEDTNAKSWQKKRLTHS